MNRGHRSQVSGLVDETIRPAMVEDFSYRNKAEARDALKELKRQVNAIKIDDIFREDDEDEFDD